MRKKLLGFLAALTLCLIGASALAVSVPATQWADYAASAFAGGTGTEADPYRIETPAQLAKLAKDVSGRQTYNNQYFRLENDLDLSAHRWNPIGVYVWMSDGATTDKPFNGFLDGNGKTITGLIVSEKTMQNTAGLFGNFRKTEGSGKAGVKDLTIQNAYIEASDDGLMENSAGILAGFVLANSGYAVEFTNVTVSGTMRTLINDCWVMTGGLLGKVARVNVSNCQALNMDIQAGSNAGGLVGQDSESSYRDCRATGKLTGTWTLGGFIGYVDTPYDSPSSFIHCYADVDVKGNDWRLGGFAGMLQHCRVENSAALGDVESTVTNFDPKVGGLIGEAVDTVVKNTHSASQLIYRKSETVGGLIGVCEDGTLNTVSYDKEKNPGVETFGTMTNTQLTGNTPPESGRKVLSNICRDYYGGHVWSEDWIVDKEPTYTEEGLKFRYCIHCGEHAGEETIPKLTQKPYDAPQTGDSSPVALWLTLLLVSGGALALSSAFRKKNTHMQ